MMSRLTSAVFLTMMIPTVAMASTARNVQTRVAQKIAGAYTSNPEENVDGRFSKALATIIGCQVGQFFKKEGLSKAADLLLAVAAEKAGVDEALVAKAKEVIATKLTSAQERLDKSLAEQCDESKWDEEFNQPGKTDKIAGFFGSDRDEVKDNLDVAKRVYEALKPEFEANKSAMISGDFNAVRDNLTREGSKLYMVLKTVGRVDFSTPAAKAMEVKVLSMSLAELIDAKDAGLDSYEGICEPNNAYKVRKVAKNSLNTASNVLEMTVSPVETMIEIAVEIFMRGDSDGMARMFRDENVAITHNDEEAHEHLQHEIQTDQCMDVIRDLEIVNRRLRSIALESEAPFLTPNEVRAMNVDDDYLHKPEEKLP